MDALDKYIKEILPIDLRGDSVASSFIENFTKEFPVKNILSINLKSFLYASKEYGYEGSFCYRLMYSPLASMGHCHPDIFGIYLKAGSQIVLSPTYRKAFGDDYNSAFFEIKSDIIKLFEAAKELDFKAIDSNRLNSAFKGILLALYHSNEFLPAPTLTALNAYCDVTGISTDRKGSTLYRNHSLVVWKNSVEECQSWSNFILMRFCDWLWRNKTTIDGKEYVISAITNKARRIAKEIDDLHLKGIDKEAVVKVRVNQGDFRDQLLKRYDSCCLCGVDHPQLLVASHIKPWAECEPDEKLDVNNGFLLCPSHDKLFDLGYISFSDDGTIIISKELGEINQLLMNINDSMKISLAEKNKKYLEYHREHIFKN